MSIKQINGNNCEFGGSKWQGFLLLKVPGAVCHSPKMNYELCATGYFTFPVFDITNLSAVQTMTQKQ
jgi:hypothetical protein